MLSVKNLVEILDCIYSHIHWYFSIDPKKTFLQGKLAGHAGNIYRGVKIHIQTYFEDIAGLIPGRCNKVNCSINQSESQYSESNEV